MEIKSKTSGIIQSAVLSCDYFTTGYFVLGAMWFFPYVAQTNGTFPLWFLPIAFLLPFAVMPLMYIFVHRTDTLLFGRYHLVMPLSALFSALFFVTAFWSGGKGASSIIGAVMFVMSVMLYRYCAFSVRARLGGEGLLSFSPYSAVWALFGAASAFGALIGFTYFDGASAFINTAYVLATVSTLLALAQYYITHYGIPRLGGKRVQSVKDVFRMFFTGLDKRVYFSSLFFLSAFAVSAVSVVPFLLTFKPNGTGVYAAAAVVGAFCLAYYISVKAVKRRNIYVSVVNLACCVVSTALFITSAVVGGNVVCTVVASAFTGAGGAVALRQTEIRFTTLKDGITGGVSIVHSQLAVAAAFGIAFLTAACVARISEASDPFASSFNPFPYIGGFAFSLLAAIVGFALSCARTSGRRAEQVAPAELPVTTDGNI